MMEKQKILIVDDSEMNRDLLADILEDQYDIIEAENGVKAIDILAGQRDAVSLVLLDIMMPEMDGFGVLRHINQNHWNDSFAVIMISADDSPANIKRAYDLGAFDYISRPFDAVIVQRRLSNTMCLYARQKQLEQMVIPMRCRYIKKAGKRSRVPRLKHTLSSCLLNQCFRFFLLQHLAIRHHFPIHHQCRSGHDPVGGDLREVRHMVNLGIHSQLRKGSVNGIFQGVAFGASAPQYLDPGSGLCRLCLCHLFRVAAAAAAGFFFRFLFVKQSHI